MPLIELCIMSSRCAHTCVPFVFVPNLTVLRPRTFIRKTKKKTKPSNPIYTFPEPAIYIFPVLTRHPRCTQIGKRRTSKLLSVSRASSRASCRALPPHTALYALLCRSS